MTTGSTPAQNIGLYGNPNVGQWSNQTVSALSATTTAYLGDYETSASYTCGATIHAIATWSGVLTATQQQAAFQKISSDLAPYNVTFVDHTDYSHGAIFSDGDSISAGFGSNWIWGATSMNQAVTLLGLDTPYYNVSVSGDSTAGAISEYSTKIAPLMRKHNSQIRVVSEAIGTNDIFASVANATILANLATYAGYVHAQGATEIIHTVLPASRNTGSQITNRTSLNSSITSDVLAGTTVGDTLSDWASEPTMGNVNNTSNTTYYVSGLHPTAVGAALLVNADALALHRLISPKTPFWFTVPIPYLAFTGTAATTQTNTIVQLMSGEQVCAAKAQITTAFSGGSVSAMTMTVGDSTGSSTTYFASKSVFATGSEINTNPAFVSNSGVVQATFTSTSANLSALTAGNVNVEIEVCGNIP